MKDGTADNRTVRSQDGIVEALQDIVTNELGLPRVPESIDPQAPLEEGLGIDSVALVQLINAAEARFGFEFEDQDLVSDSFADLETLAGVISRRTGV